MTRMSSFVTFAAWMAALSYLAAGVYGLGSNSEWWSGNLVELALLAGLGNFFLLWVIAPLTRSVFAERRAAVRGTRALAFAAAVLGACMTGVVFLMLSSFFREGINSGFSRPHEAPFDSPLYWLLTLGLFGPWFIQLSVGAWKARSWPAPLAAAGTLAGIVAMLVPVTFLPFRGALPLAILVSIVGGLSLPLWLLGVSARIGNTAGAARLAVFTLLLLLVLAGGTQIWARSRLAEYERNWTQELAAERARTAALRMPVLRGDAVACNAAERYLPLLDSLSHSGFPDGTSTGKRDTALFNLAPDLSQAASASPFEPLPAKLVPILEERRKLVASLREAMRCERVDWGYRFERGFAAPLPSLLAARVLGNLTTLEGHERAQAGDLQGAAEHYLDVMRFGADFESQGVLISSLIGLALRGIGQDALGALVVNAPAGKLPAGPILEQMNRLAAVQASVAAGLRGEHLALVPAAVNQGFGAPLLELLVGRPLFAQALGRILPTLHDAEKAAEEPDLLKAAARMEPEFVAAAQSRNPITASFLPSLGRASRSAAMARARQAVVQAALAAEVARTRENRYPAELPDLPLDAFAYPAKVHYRADAGAASYTVWSVGGDGKDDGGTGRWFRRAPAAADDKDIVLTRSR